MSLYDIASAAAAQYGVPPDLFSAQITQESSWNPYASNGSAYGIAQFQPATAAQYGVDVTDPTSSLYGAAAYDASLYNQYGSWTAALQHYGTLPSSGDLSTGQQGVAALASTYDNGGTYSVSGLDTSRSWLSELGRQIGDLSNANSPAGNQGYGILPTGSTAGIQSSIQSAASSLSPSSWLSTIDTFLSSWLERGIFVLLGLFILIVAIFMLGRKDTVIQITKEAVQ